MLPCPRLTEGARRQTPTCIACAPLTPPQATLQGVLTAGMFFFISHAQPLPELSQQRPHPRVFSPYVFSSLLGQFAVYISFLMAMQHMAHALMPKVWGSAGWRLRVRVCRLMR